MDPYIDLTVIYLLFGHLKTWVSFFCWFFFMIVFLDYLPIYINMNAYIFMHAHGPKVNLRSVFGYNVTIIFYLYCQ